MAKKGKDTLKDLNAFLNRAKPEQQGTGGKEGFLKSEPNTLVNIKSATDILQQHDSINPETLAEIIRSYAKESGESLANTLSKVIIHCLDNEEAEEASSLLLLNTAMYIGYTENLHDQLHEKE